MTAAILTALTMVAIWAIVGVYRNNLVYAARMRYIEKASEDAKRLIAVGESDFLRQHRVLDKLSYEAQLSDWSAWTEEAMFQKLLAVSTESQQAD